MNFEFFIAKRLSSAIRNSLSKPVITISVISIALGLALMIISVAVVIGFKKSVSDKVMGFASHIQLVYFDNNNSVQEKPVQITDELLQKLHSNSDISHFQTTAQKAGVIKTEDQIQGVVLKGIDSTYNMEFLAANITKGKLPDIKSLRTTNEILISEIIANKLHLDTSDIVRIWFVDEENATARGRKLIVSGVYKTGMEEFDNIYVIGDLRHVRKLNGWNTNQTGSVEIFLKNPDKIRDIAFNLYSEVPYNIYVKTVFDDFPQIFNWLELLDMNVVVILTLLILVATITMISTQLIIIIERTSMIGLLKAVGAKNISVKKIFMYMSGKIVFTGMIWGNIIGLAFYFIQNNYHIISLSAESYYVDYVPVMINPLWVILLNLGTFLISLLVLIIPSIYLTRVLPAKALRYE